MSPENIVNHDMHFEYSWFQKYSDRAIEYILEYAPRLVIAVLTLVIGLWVIRKFVRITERAMQRRGLEISLRTFLRSLIAISLRVILLITVAGMMGFQTTSLVTILGAAGLAIGLALQGSLSNFAGGVLILVLKPYRVGDSIETMGQKGVVQEIQIFHTLLITADNRTVVLPNGAVSNSLVINQSREGTLRSVFDVNLGNDQDPEKIKAVLLDIINSDNRVGNIPFPPAVVFSRSAVNGYTLQARFYTSEADSSLVHSDLIQKVNRTFFEQGIKEPVQRIEISNS